MTIVLADRGLHLGVLHALLTRGAIGAADLTAVIESGPAGGRPGPRLSAALDRLHALGLPAAEVAAIDRLDFDGGNDLYLLIERTLDVDTGGESDDYNVTSLAGIHQLPALRSLNLDGHGYHPGPLDLTPLSAHPALATLFLTGECTAAGTLESLPALRDLDVTLATLDDPGIVPRLEARRVTVRRRGPR